MSKVSTRLLICLITYNRLDYTKRTLKSLLDTVDVPYYLVVVDNNSTDGTKKWLKQQYKEGRIDGVLFGDKNYYPGKACNLGWVFGLEYYNPTHLMRCDNDMVFYPNWGSLVEKYFQTFPELGQLGLDYGAIKGAQETSRFGWKPFVSYGPLFDLPYRTKKRSLELIHWPGSVGGLSIIKKEVWDKGVRYTERPWHDGGENYIAPQEDSMLSMNVLHLGYQIGHVSTRVAQTFGDIKHWKDDPKYYLKALKSRGYHRVFPEQIAKLEKL